MSDGALTPPSLLTGRLALVALLVISAFAMTVNLGGRDVTNTMEAVTVGVSLESWQRWHDGDDAALMIGKNDDVPRLRKPPLVMWVNFLAWTGLDSRAPDVDALVWRARFVCVLLSLLVIVATHEIGRVLGGPRLAILAALVVASSLFFQRQARIAAYDQYMAGFVAIGVASALWGLRPTGPRPGTGRLVLGWLGCAVAMVLGCYAKSPLTIGLVAVPVLALAALDRERRWSAILGFLLATALTAAAVVPWYVHALDHFPEGSKALLVELRQKRADGGTGPHYYFGLFALVSPWVIWLIAGLIHPFSRTVRRWPAERVGRWLPWIWFVAIFVIFSLHEAKSQRYMLPIMPAAALLVAMVWHDHQRLADAGERDEGTRPFIWLHWIALIVVSAALGLLTSGVIDASADTLAPMGLVFGAITAIVLLTLAVLGLRRHVAWQPHRAAVLCGLWGIVMLAAFWRSYGDAPSGRQPLRAPAEALLARVGDAPIRLLRGRAGTLKDRRLDEYFRIYYGPLIPHLQPDEVTAYVAQAVGPVYVLAPDFDADRAVLLDAGFTALDQIQIDHHREMRLWRREDVTTSALPG